MNKYIYPLVDNPFRKKDLKSAIEVIKTGRITMSKNVAAFENQFSWGSGLGCSQDMRRPIPSP